MIKEKLDEEEEEYFNFPFDEHKKFIDELCLSYVSPTQLPAIAPLVLKRDLENTRKACLIDWYNNLEDENYKQYLEENPSFKETMQRLIISHSCQIEKRSAWYRGMEMELAIHFGCRTVLTNIWRQLPQIDCLIVRNSIYLEGLYISGFRASPSIKDVVLKLVSDNVVKANVIGFLDVFTGRDVADITPAGLLCWIDEETEALHYSATKPDQAGDWREIYFKLVQKNNQWQVYFEASPNTTNKNLNAIIQVREAIDGLLKNLNPELNANDFQVMMETLNTLNQVTILKRS